MTGLLCARIRKPIRAGIRLMCGSVSSVEEKIIKISVINLIYSKQYLQICTCTWYIHRKNKIFIIIGALTTYTLHITKGCWLTVLAFRKIYNLQFIHTYIYIHAYRSVGIFFCWGRGHRGNTLSSQPFCQWKQKARPYLNISVHFGNTNNAMNR